MSWPVAEASVHLALGIAWVLIVIGVLLSSSRGKGPPRETIAWAVTGVILYALFFWPGWVANAVQ